MTASNGNSPAVASLMQKVAALADEAEEELRRLEDERTAFLSEIDNEIREIRSFLKRTRGSQSSPKPAATTKRYPSYGKVSKRSMETVLTAALSTKDEKFTPLGLQEQHEFPFSTAHTYQTFSYLRKRGFLRKAGKGNGPNPRTQWVVDDREGGERFLKELTDAPA